MKHPLPTDYVWTCPLEECGGEVRARRAENLDSAVARHNSMRHGLRKEYTGRDRIRAEVTSIPQERLQSIRRVLGPTVIQMTVPSDADRRHDDPEFVRKPVRVSDSSATLHRLFELFNRDRPA